MKTRQILAALGLVLVAPALSACSLFVPSTANRDSDGNIKDAQEVSAFALQVGDCLVTADLEDIVNKVPAKPCAEPHDAEIIRAVRVADLIDYDEEAVIGQANQSCEAAINDIVGPNWAEAGLDWDYFYPTTESWDDGDREILCLAYTPELSLTAGVADMGR
jgi:hypothetical protein